MRSNTAMGEVPQQVFSDRVVAHASHPTRLQARCGCPGRDIGGRSSGADVYAVGHRVGWTPSRDYYVQQ
ncbi:MAG TPA: hypothetical protein VG815_07500 [Chloroflexota bacterium]|nr:hypothetical protein [Chloroflexota bacterium]